jgi:lipopolysaccharide/colanic/teichoic acid biosynthesis glycosyltransferase
VASPLCASVSNGRLAQRSITSRCPNGRSADNHSVTWLVHRVLLIIWDALGWAVALVVASSLRADFSIRGIETRPFLIIVAVAVVAQLVVHALLRTYRGRHPIGGIDEAITVAVGTALVAAIVFIVDSSVEQTLVPRSVPLLAAPIAVLIAVGSRLAVRLYRERHYRADYSRAHRVIVLGAGTDGQHLLRSMLTDPTGRYLPVALLDDNQFLRRYRISGVAVRGTRADVADAAAESNADMLVIADRSLPRPVVDEIASSAREAGLAVAMLPTLDDLLRPLPHESLVPAPGSATVDVPAEREERRDAARDVAGAPAAAAQSRAKRAMDIALCLVGIWIAIPLLVVIAVVLKFTAGEVIYRAPRIGRDGQLFTMFKFVTMTRDDSGPRVTGRGDLRITEVGRWLRTTKLNELPQLFNVLKGEMSVVGPRPEDPRYAAHYSARHLPVLAVRPGLTSLAFLRFGDEEEFIARAEPTDVEAYYLQELLPEKLEIELDYVRTWSLRQDMRILAGTVRTLVS